jgi:hypothetical protein
VVAFGVLPVKQCPISVNVVNYRRELFLGLVLLGMTSLTGSQEELLPNIEPRLSASSRIVVVSDEKATDTFNSSPDRVGSMVEKGLIAFTEKASLKEAMGTFVNPGDRIGVKVYSEPGKISGTRVSVVEPVIRGLLEAGIAASEILVWDWRLVDLENAGYGSLTAKFGVRLRGAMESGFDPEAAYENEIVGQLVWGDHEYDPEELSTSRKSYLSKLVTQEIDKIINIAPLMNNHYAGVSGLLWSLAMGSADNTIRFQREAARLAVAVPELNAMEQLGDRVVLNIVDGLLCQYQGQRSGLLHYSTALNQIRIGRDPVALDVMSLETLERQREVVGLESNAFVGRELFENAELLEIGVSDSSRFEIVQVP